MSYVIAFIFCGFENWTVATAPFARRDELCHASP
jgi:hypothetical protein